MADVLFLRMKDRLFFFDFLLRSCCFGDFFVGKWRGNPVFAT